MIIENLSSLISPLLKLAKAAGDEILTVYRRPKGIEITIKADDSPVTQADMAAHKIIVAGLERLTPEVPILSEEAASIPYETRKRWQQYWLVDPLDGTKEFIHRTDEFTVNIALIVDGHSQLGVIYGPVTDCYYYAVAKKGAYKQQDQQTPISIHSRKTPDDSCVITISRRHSVKQAQRFMAAMPDHQALIKGSSLKTCVVAEGLADIYPSLGPTSEWDMGAAQCIIEEAGGAMVTLDGAPLRFNQKPSLLNPPLLVVGDPEYDWLKLMS